MTGMKEETTISPGPGSVLRSYLTALDEGRLEQAAAHFSDDALFVRTAPSSGGPVAARFIRGRPAILAAILDRGVQAHQHEVTAEVDDGRHAMVEGRISGGTSDVFFALHAVVGHDGLMKRYIGFSATCASEELSAFIDVGG